MARTLVFDVSFKDSSGLGQIVAQDIRVELFEEGESLPKETRYIGTSSNTSILQTTDAEGVLYTTTVDVTNYARGSITAKWYATQGGNPVSPYPFVESLANIFSDKELTTGDIKTFIRSMLGFPAVSVELSGAHYTAIIGEALDLYSQHIPAENIKRIELQQSIQVYNCPELPFNGPFDVKFVRKVIAPSAPAQFFGREYFQLGDVDLGTYMLSQSYAEMALRVLNIEPDWRWLHETKDLYITTGPGLSSQVYGGYDVAVRYFTPLTLPKVREDHFRWFKRYCLAQAKLILAQIRGKFSGNLPAPGGPLTLNSADLLQQGTKEQDELVQELKDMAPHTPPISG